MRWATRLQFTPEMMLRETVEYKIENNLVGNCGEDPFDDELVEILIRKRNLPLPGCVPICVTRLRSLFLIS